jgi:hypothetical protein
MELGKTKEIIRWMKLKTENTYFGSLPLYMPQED